MQGLQAYFGLGDESLWQMATGLGAGMARRQSVCGAITGGILALGMITAHRRASAREDVIGLRDETYARVQQLMEGFEEEYGSVECRVLTACDFSDSEQRRAFSEGDGMRKVCYPAVRYVMETVARLVE